MEKKIPDWYLKYLIPKILKELPKNITHDISYTLNMNITQCYFACIISDPWK